VTPHKLRHTFDSILVALGRDPSYVMAQLGHTDPSFTLRVYAHAMRFGEEKRARLKALCQGREWAPVGLCVSGSCRRRRRRDPAGGAIPRCAAVPGRWAILDSNQGPLPYQGGPGLAAACGGSSFLLLFAAL
jgi:hypothetical protein